MTNIKEVSETSRSAHSKAASCQDSDPEPSAMGSVRNDTSRVERTEQEATEQREESLSEEISEHKSYQSDDNFGAKADQQTFIAKQRDVLVTKENYDSDDSDVNEDEIKKWKNKDDSGRSA